MNRGIPLKVTIATLNIEPIFRKSKDIIEKTEMEKRFKHKVKQKIDLSKKLIFSFNFNFFIIKIE
jgi:hypothetical protein